MIVLEFEPTEAELKQVLSINLATPRAKRVRLIEQIIGLLLLIGGIAEVINGFVLGGVILVIAGLILAALTLFGPALAGAGTKLGAVDKRVEITDDSIAVTTPRGTRTTPWSSVRRSIENPLAFSVMGQPVVGTILKRAMSPAQQDELRAMLTKRAALQSVGMGEV